MDSALALTRSALKITKARSVTVIMRTRGHRLAAALTVFEYPGDILTEGYGRSGQQVLDLLRKHI